MSRNNNHSLPSCGVGGNIMTLMAIMMMMMVIMTAHAFVPATTINYKVSSFRLSASSSSSSTTAGTQQQEAKNTVAPQPVADPETTTATTTDATELSSTSLVNPRGPMSRLSHIASRNAGAIPADPVGAGEFGMSLYDDDNDTSQSYLPPLEDSIDRHFSPEMLNPKNRRILGLYSDEGIGYEKGGATITHRYSPLRRSTILLDENTQLVDKTPKMPDSYYSSIHNKAVQRTTPTTTTYTNHADETAAPAMTTPPAETAPPSAAAAAAAVASPSSAAEKAPDKADSSSVAPAKAAAASEEKSPLAPTKTTTSTSSSSTTTTTTSEAPSDKGVSSSAKVETWQPSMAAFKTEERFMTPSMIQPRPKSVTTSEEKVSASSSSAAAAAAAADKKAKASPEEQPPSIVPVDPIDRWFSSDMLKPMEKTPKKMNNAPPVSRTKPVEKAAPTSPTTFAAARPNFALAPNTDMWNDMNAQRQELAARMTQPQSSSSSSTQQPEKQRAKATVAQQKELAAIASKEQKISTSAESSQQSTTYTSDSKFTASTAAAAPPSSNHDGFERGTVLWFNTLKGYGFIRPSSSDKDSSKNQKKVFVHHTAIQTQDSNGFRKLSPGDIVQFEQEKYSTDDDNKGGDDDDEEERWRAVNVQKV